MTYLEDAASSAATAANEVQALRAVENAQASSCRDRGEFSCSSL